MCSREIESGADSKGIFADRSRALSYLRRMKSEQALFGERLRAALKSAGYPESPSEISRLLPRFRGDAATPQAVSAWLHGKSIPRARSIRALAEMCRIEPAMLQYGHDGSGKRVRETQVAFRVSAPDQHAIDAFIALPARKRKLVRDFIDTLSETEKKR
jgi:transcriptional regulator with XRE-family HTH domain